MTPLSRRTAFVALTTVALLATITTCGGKHGSGGQQDATVVCQGDDDCPTGQICIGNVCQAPGDGGVDAAPPAEPDIAVSPAELDFGFAPLRVDTVLPLTIRNNGQADLQVDAILVEEVDQQQEFHANPEGVISPPLVVAPGEAVQIDVTLRPEDAELDSGQLRINSNDPDQPTLTIPLRSGYKGNPDLEACALDPAVPDPEPFVDCDEEPTTGEAIIDFGVVQFQNDATRLVAVRNLADGNAPLTITDISVTNTSGLGGHFSLEIFWLEVNEQTQESTEIPAALPAYLRAADPILTLPADNLYVRVTFDGDLDGFLPEEFLVYQSNDSAGALSIPIFGVVSGCPLGTWDLNGDPNDGCEYLCDYTGPETCDGADNDCDGLVDEEDAGGCTVYYRDADNDTYGVTADARCLCAPDPVSRHTATSPGDCNDAKNTVNPGMLEQCSTPDDDDCDGDTNDQDAYGCTMFYADQDTDGFGVTTNARCYCQAAGFFTATAAGDCDDANPNVNPSRLEDCNTPQDDDCSGSTNDEDAQNCLDYYVDLDNDSYGQTFLSRCLCTASGTYRALMPNDCNDNNPNVNPGVVENCNTSYDDNCDGDTNELNASFCTTYYLDADNDGAGVTGDSQCRCAALGNYRATVGGDCNDANGAVHPTAVETCATTYDDDCDGDTNDLNATGCTNYYYDGDQDTYGVASNVECRCAASGSYTATVAGDCNDANGAVNPGATEDCLTAYDDNCNGSTNELNANNCTTFFMDADNDTYGNGAVPAECRCAVSGLYRAVQPGDCNDSLAAINPGATEVCDLVDNNCMGGIDEGFNLLTDVSHCGSCNHACVNPHGTRACVSGQCVPTCVSGWGDCNGAPDDGCETDLSTVTTCGTCTQDSTCPDGFYCSGTGVCTKKKPDGGTCTRREMCVSDFCVDGVCCDTACDATCEACNLSGTEGTCSPHGAGLDPENECTGTAQSTCGLNGFCDGNRGCAQWPSGTVCQAQSCTGNTLNPADTCNGTGTCVDGGTQDCSPFLCGGSACRTTCTDSSHCVSGFYCTGGACVGKKPNGTTCGGAGECQSGNCVDGVCCDSACSGLCTACNLSASMGTCSPIAGGTDPQNECGLCRTCNGAGGCVNAGDGSDPKAECVPQDVSTCGRDGECNGAGGCRNWAFGSECVAQTCTGNTKYLRDTCNGAGTCVDGGTVNCSPYLCNGAGTDCRTTCSSNADCVATSFCNAGACDGKKSNGQACSDGSQCTSNFCADGVCCNAACGGTCRSCSLSGAVGTCTNIPANTDPDGECSGTCRSCNGAAACAPTTAGADPENECAAQPASTCSTDGECDGAGACRLHASGTECVAQSCTGSTLSPADSCNGTGTCSDSGTAPCDPYQCNTTGTACRTDCSVDTHCTNGNYCAAGLCAAKKTPGQTCSAANECTSGYCVDGVCCNTSCPGACRACNVGGQEGTCVNHTTGTDPENGCGTCKVCDGAGACTNAANNTDPKNNCAQDPQGSCGLDGLCDGGGACGYWTTGTVCVSASCVDADTLALSDTCDGAGLCVDQGQLECSPYVCAAGACRSTCTNDGHCTSGYYCSGGACVAKLSGGQACTAANQCLTGFCADGVCCNTQCDGTCRACNRPGQEGTCSPYSSGTDPETECLLCQVCNGGGACAPATAGSDPKAECAAAAQNTCGLDGQCNGTGACRYWALGTECAAQSCSGSTKYLADTCNGGGSCVDGGSQSCSPYTCSGTDCRTSCAAHTDCATGYYCNGSGACVGQKINGLACGAAEECQAGFCVDGVCCNNACTGTCRACNLSGSAGTCSNIAVQTDPQAECGLCRVCNGAGACVSATDGSDPKNECATSSETSCGLDGACNGAGACGNWPSSTVCVPESCTNHVKQLNDYCNGSGACVDSGTQDCSPYECEGVNCRTSCTADLHCISGYYCNGSACVAKKPNGQTCSAGNQCTSGSCVDGVCCNNACTGTCRACDVAGSVGTCTLFSNLTDPDGECGGCQTCNGAGACTNATAGTDPKSYCTAAAQSTCDYDGQCDGSGACRNWASGTVCQAQSCSGATLSAADTCNGSGQCIDNGSSACANNLTCLNATTCRTSCTDNSHCVTGYHCGASNQCVPDAPAGATCTFDTDCASTYCRDGYCCNTSCAGACRACDLPTLEGTCTNIPANTDPDNDCPLCQVCNGAGACTNAAAGTDPLNECPANAPSTCGLNGSCSGSGSCAYWASGTTCLAQSCSGSTLYVTDTCNGSGTCTDNGTQACAGNLTCADSTSCRTTCSQDSHCNSGFYCSGGACLAKKSLGTTCGGGNECSSGNCVDGVCCNNSCTGACRACNRAGSLGTCSNYPSGSDPETECGGCQQCNGSGACANVTAGTDPKDYCPTQSPCGLDGTCAGDGTCHYWSSGTVCVAQSCTGSTLSTADLCNGTGTCVNTGTQACANNLTCLDSTSCRTSCSQDAHCVSGYYCSGGACVAKKPNGQTCGGGNQCTSGNCIDGYCCNNGCGGTCMACNVAGHLGTCWAVPANTDPIHECGGACRSCNGAGACGNSTSGTDPEDECATMAASTCGTKGNCNGSGACELWALGTVCGSGYCNGNTANPNDLCDGFGTCLESGSSLCDPFVCSGGSCPTQCTTDAQCVGGYNCVGVSCCQANTPANTASSCGAATTYTTLYTSTGGSLTYIGNVVPEDGEWWYEFRVYESSQSDPIRVYTWLSNNPSDQYRIKVWTASNDASTPWGNDCSEASQSCITTEYQRYTWNCNSGNCATHWNDRSFYVRVYRRAGVTGTCENYTLRIQLNGTAPY